MTRRDRKRFKMLVLASIMLALILFVSVSVVFAATKANVKSNLKINYTGTGGTAKAAGLYDGNDNILSTWDDLIGNGAFDVVDGMLTQTEQTKDSFNGEELIISDEVTTIGSFAFQDCNLVSISIPRSVQTIEPLAFFGCYNLTSVSFDDISGWKCSEKEYCSSCADLSPTDLEDLTTSVEYLTNNYVNKYWINVPEAGVYFDDEIFVPWQTLVNDELIDTSKVYEIGIDDTYQSFDELMYISAEIFDGRYGYGQVTIVLPNSIMEIDENAFAGIGYNDFKKLVIPDSVAKIDAGAFKESKVPNLTNVKFIKADGWLELPYSSSPLDVEEIYYTSLLNEISARDYLVENSSMYFSCLIPGVSYSYDEFIPWEVIQYEYGDAFNWDSDYEFEYGMITDDYFITGDAFVVLPNTLKEIGDSAFQYSDIRKIIISDSVKTIGSNAFESSPRLTNVVIGNNVEIIGENAFSGCSYLHNIVLGSSVKTIDSGAFRDCQFSELNIPSSVTYIGPEAFANAGSASVTFEIPYGWYDGYASEQYNDESFYSYTEFLDEGARDRVMNGGIARVNEPGLYYADGGLDYSWDDVLGDQYLFEDGDIITNIVEGFGSNSILILPSSIQAIDIPEHYGGTWPECVILPYGLKYIGNRSFEGSYEMKTVNIPSSVRYIGEYAFSQCGNLENIIIPESVLEIGKHAFSGCTYLQTATISAKIIGEYAFEDCNSFSEIIINYGVREIHSNAFIGTLITSLNIPYTVTYFAGNLLGEIESITFEQTENWITTYGEELDFSSYNDAERYEYLLTIYNSSGCDFMQKNE